MSASSSSMVKSTRIASRKPLSVSSITVTNGFGFEGLRLVERFFDRFREFVGAGMLFLLPGGGFRSQLERRSAGSPVSDACAGSRGSTLCAPSTSIAS
jgi:hypothetical protein